MENHYINIAKIIKTFCKSNDLLMCYTEIDDIISINSHSNLNINSEWNENLTLKELYDKKSKLYEDIRKYLELNKIEEPLIIKTESRGWAFSDFTLSFRKEFKFNI
jgi:hypothetical protein